MISLKPSEVTPIYLETYCKENWSAIYKEKMGTPGGKPKDAARLGYDIYSRSRSRDMDIMIIGPNRIREDQELVKNVGCVLGNINKKRIAKLEDGQSHVYKGAILGEKQWSGFINDLYMLGGVHARKVFHFSIKRGRPLRESDVWDREKGHLNTTGRELLLLKLAGYKKVSCPFDADSSILGHIFVPSSTENMPPISFAEYRRKIYEVKDPGEVLSLFNRTVELSTYNSCGGERT